MADFERQHAALPPTPGPTLERHDPQDPGLYHTNPHTDLPEHLDVQDEGPHVVNGPGHGTKEYALQDPEKIERASRICGLRRKIFWPLLGLVILIVVGAIAGGLGGALVNQKNNDASYVDFYRAQSPIIGNTDFDIVFPITRRHLYPRPVLRHLLRHLL